MVKKKKRIHRLRVGYREFHKRRFEIPVFLSELTPTMTLSDLLIQFRLASNLRECYKLYDKNDVLIYDYDKSSWESIPDIDDIDFIKFKCVWKNTYKKRALILIKVKGLEYLIYFYKENFDII